MKRFAMAIALACALSGTGVAGDVHSTGSPEPAPPPPPQEISTGDSHTTGNSATPGEMPTCDVTLALLTLIDLVF